ncbi:MAG TPA: FtsX-like permease family protein [Candidatus Nitrosotalea sp.]|nr:FtsX-like permease family protein [Candidatus Nitrosotalea sp.]
MRWAPSLTLAGLAVRRLIHQWPLALAQLLGVTAAVTLAASIPLMESAAAEAGLRQSLGSIGAGGSLEIERLDTRTAASYDEFQDSSAKRLVAELGGDFVPGARYALTSALAALTHNGSPVTGEGGDPPETVRYYDGLQAHAQLVAGSWSATGAPPGYYAMTVPQQLAGRIDLKAGDSYCLRLPAVLSRGKPAPPRDPACFFLSGIWTPSNVNDTFWGGITPIGFVLDRAAYFSFVPSLIAPLPQPLPPDTPCLPYCFGTVRESSAANAGQFWAPDLARMHAADVPRVLSRLTQVQGEFTVGRNVTFITGLPAAFENFEARVQNAHSAGLVVEVALLAIAFYAVGFVGSLYLDGQLGTVSLWRARGWSRRRLWWLLIFQFAIISLLAAPLGLALAFTAVQLLAASVLGPSARVPDADLPGLEPVLVAAVAAGIALLGWQASAATDRGLVDARRQASRPAAKPWWQARNIDLLLAVVGAVVLGYSHFSSGATATSDAGHTDPLSLLLPVAGLALLAPASLRLLALAPQIIGGRGRPLTGTLTAWQLRRHAGQHVRLALLLSFAIAVVLFASTYAATDRQNVTNRAGYQAGADVRALFAVTGLPPPTAAIASMPGVVGATQLYRGSGRPGQLGLDTTVLGIDGAGVWSAAWRGGELGSSRLDITTKLLAERDPDGVLVTGQPRQLSLWVYSSGFDGRLSAGLTDSGGQPTTVVLGDLSFTGWKQLSTSINVMSYPIRLRSLLIDSTGPRLTGAVALSDLAADGTVFEKFEQPGGWWRQTAGAATAIVALPTGPGQVRDGRQAVGARVDLNGGAMLIRPALAAKPLPALFSARTLDKLGIGLGRPFTLRIQSTDLPLTAIGTVDYFPTLYPGDDFLMVPRIALLDRLTRDTQEGFYTNEMWLRVDGPTSKVVSRIHDTMRTSVIDLVDRQQLEAAALEDPLRQSLHAELLIGYLAALAMVVVGYGLHFLAVTRGRVAEFAILQANGLPWRQVRRGLLAEQIILLAYGLLVGAGMGLLLSWVILPQLHLGTSASDLTPPTVLVVDRMTAGFAMAVLALGCVTAGQLAVRLGGRFQLVRQLRELA